MTYHYRISRDIKCKNITGRDRGNLESYCSSRNRKHIHDTDSMILSFHEKIVKN